MMRFRELDLSRSLRRDVLPLCGTRSYAKDEILFFKEDTSDDIFYVEDGVAKAVAIDADGHSIFFADFEEGDIFGYYAAYTKRPRTATLIAATALRVRIIPAKLFQAYISGDAHRSETMMSYLAQKLRQSSERILRNTILPGPERVAAYLISTLEESGSDDVRVDSREDLASQLSLTRETLSRILNRFAKESLIALGQNQITILDRAGLYSLISLS